MGKVTWASTEGIKETNVAARGRKESGVAAVKKVIGVDFTPFKTVKAERVKKKRNPYEK